MEATAVKEITDGGRCQRLFRLHPFLDNCEYVIASRCNAMCASIQGCYEVYLFPADADGNVTDWCELEGSQKHCSDLNKPLMDLGYAIKQSVS